MMEKKFVTIYDGKDIIVPIKVSSIGIGSVSGVYVDIFATDGLYLKEYDVSVGTFDIENLKWVVGNLNQSTETALLTFSVFNEKLVLDVDEIEISWSVSYSGAVDKDIRNNTSNKKFSTISLSDIVNGTTEKQQDFYYPCKEISYKVDFYNHTNEVQENIEVVFESFNGSYYISADVNYGEAILGKNSDVTTLPIVEENLPCSGTYFKYLTWKIHTLPKGETATITVKCIVIEDNLSEVGKFSYTTNHPNGIFNGKSGTFLNKGISGSNYVKSIGYKEWSGRIYHSESPQIFKRKIYSDNYKAIPYNIGTANFLSELTVVNESPGEFLLISEQEVFTQYVTATQNKQYSSELSLISITYVDPNTVRIVVDPNVTTTIDINLSIFSYVQSECFSITANSNSVCIGESVNLYIDGPVGETVFVENYGYVTVQSGGTIIQVSPTETTTYSILNRSNDCVFEEGYSVTINVIYTEDILMLDDICADGGITNVLFYAVNRNGSFSVGDQIQTPLKITNQDGDSLPNSYYGTSGVYFYVTINSETDTEINLTYGEGECVKTKTFPINPCECKSVFNALDADGTFESAYDDYLLNTNAFAPINWSLIGWEPSEGYVNTDYSLRYTAYNNPLFGINTMYLWVKVGKCIETVLSTIPGLVYTVSFYYNPSNGLGGYTEDEGGFYVEVDGVNSIASVRKTELSQKIFHSFDFTATGTSTTLSLCAQGSGEVDGVQIDNIKVLSKTSDIIYEIENEGEVCLGQTTLVTPATINLFYGEEYDVLVTDENGNTIYSNEGISGIVSINTLVEPAGLNTVLNVKVTKHGRESCFIEFSISVVLADCIPSCESVDIEVSHTGDRNLCEDLTIVATGGTAPYSYLWFTGPGESISIYQESATLSGSTYCGSSCTLYYTVLDANGCSPAIVGEIQFENVDPCNNLLDPYADGTFDSLTTVASSQTANGNITGSGFTPLGTPDSWAPTVSLGSLVASGMQPSNSGGVFIGCHSEGEEGIEITIPTIVGEFYDIFFEQANAGRRTNSIGTVGAFKFDINGDIKYSPDPQPFEGFTLQTWSEQAVAFEATSTSSTIKITAFKYTEDVYMAIDNLRVYLVGCN